MHVCLLFVIRRSIYVSLFEHPFAILVGRKLRIINLCLFIMFFRIFPLVSLFVLFQSVCQQLKSPRMTHLVFNNRSLDSDLSNNFNDMLLFHIGRYDEPMIKLEMCYGFFGFLYVILTKMFSPYILSLMVSHDKSLFMNSFFIAISTPPPLFFLFFVKHV